MNLLNKLKSAWSNLPLETRKEITSFTHTFVATFGVFLSTQIAQGGLVLTKSAIMSLGAAAARAALKAAFKSYLEHSKKSDDAPPPT